MVRSALMPAWCFDRSVRMTLRRSTRQRSTPSTFVSRTTTAAPLLTVTLGIGALLAATVPAAASGNMEPAITPTAVTFAVPAGQPGTSWRLRLWSSGILEGTATGTSGMLAVTVPDVVPCSFQADVTATPAGGKAYFYSGARRSFSACGGPRTTQTLAGDIFLCSTTGTATATEVPGGTLGASGPSPLAPNANPLDPTSVAAGTYTLTATAPAGFLFVPCGATVVIGSGNLSASIALAVAAGGSGRGSFFVASTAAGGGGGPSRSNPGGPSGATSPGGSGGSAPAAAAGAVSVAASTVVPVQSSQLALTGASVTRPTVVGTVLFILGMALTLIGRRRRLGAASDGSP